MSLDFDNQGFVVTGPSGPLGSMLSEMATRRGAHLMFCLPPGAAWSSEGAPRLSHMTAELSREEEADRLFDMAVDRLPEIRVLISVLDVPREDASRALHETSPADWNRACTAPLRSAFLVSQRAVQEFLAAGKGGRIIFVIQGARPRAGQTIHFTLQYALGALCRSITKEYGRREITANVLLVPDAGTAEAGPIAETVLFLASPEASFVNGQVLQAGDGQAQVLAGGRQYVER